MEILFVCHHLPYRGAPHSGGTDVFHYMESLGSRHAVSLISFVTPEEARHVEELQQVCRQLVTVPHSKSWPARLGRLPPRLVYPMQHGHTRSAHYRAALRKLAENRFDVAHIEAPWMAQYLDELRPAACVLDEVDIYSLVAWQSYRQARGLRRWCLGFEWAKLAAYELRACRRADAVVARSQHDVAWLRERLPGKPVEILPPWFEGLESLASIPATRPAGNDVLFMGAMNRPGNVQAVCDFVRDCWPLVRTQVPDARLLVVGGAPSPEITRMGERPDIVVTGYVQDLNEWYRRAAVVIAPLPRAGGILVKVLNGLAAARPVVASSPANAGVGAQAGVEIVVADRPGDTANAIGSLLRDPAHWDQLAHAGRHFVQTHYDWNEAMRRLEELYARPLEGKKP